MPRDYASRPNRRAAGHRAGRGAGGLRSFAFGLACGVCLSAVVWLASPRPEVSEVVERAAEAALGEGELPPLRFDFYDILQQQAPDVAVEGEGAPGPRAARGGARYMLQAGSFRQAGDADSRRAELLLLGLEARVEETDGDTGRWYRVYIGPFETRPELARARGLTAQQGIDTLPLLVDGPG